MMVVCIVRILATAGHLLTKACIAASNPIHRGARTKVPVLLTESTYRFRLGALALHPKLTVVVNCRDHFSPFPNPMQP